MLVSKGAACSAINCSNAKVLNPELSFFNFPKDEERCKQWIQNMRRDDFTIKDAKYSRLCSLHFDDLQFVNAKKKRLVWNAVPIIFDIPDSPHKDKEDQDKGDGYGIKAKRRKITTAEPSKAVVEKSAPPVHIKQEPNTDEKNDEPKTSGGDWPSLAPFARIKVEQFHVEEANISAEESEVYEPAFVAVQETVVNCKQEVFEDEDEVETSQSSEEIHESSATQVDPFTSVGGFQDPSISKEVVNEITSSGIGTSESILDDMPLLKRRAVASASQKPPITAPTRGHSTTVVKRVASVTNRKRAPTPPLLPPNLSMLAGSKKAVVIKKDSDEWFVLQRICWLRQQKNKVEEHIRRVRQEKQLKEKMEESHSALCRCNKCKLGIAGNVPQKVAIPRVSNRYITTTKLCSQCNRVFKYEGTYLSHIEKCGKPSSTGIKVDMPYVCSFCGEVFDDSTKQLKHLTACPAKAESIVTNLTGGIAAKHTCTLCGEKLPNEAAQMRHLKICFMNKPYQCYTCGRSFHDPEMRGIHVRRIHDEEKVCLQCGLPIQTEQELESHVRLQCCKTIITFPCQHCDRRFYNEKSRTIHTAMHSEPSLLDCIFCHEKFVTESELCRHKDSIHLRLMEKNKCSLCGETFDTEILKMKHSLNCFQQKQCLCLVCGKRFGDHKSRSEHITKVHNNEGKDMCHQCGLKCGSISNLQKHQESDCNTKEEEASNCPSVPIKQEPVDIEEQQKFACSVCCKEFHSEAGLDEHTVTHMAFLVSDEEEEDPQTKMITTLKLDNKEGSTSYQCEPCDILFVSHRELLLHTYNAHNKYLCFYPTCGMTFNHANRRIKHFESHSVKPINQKSAAPVNSELEKNQSKVTIAEKEEKPDSSASLVTDNSSKLLPQDNNPTADVSGVQQVKMGESHSAMCLCIKCKSGITDNIPKTLVSNQYVTTTKLCSKCNRTFKYEGTYLSHIENCGKPPVDMPYICSLCGEVFDDSTTQLKHLITCPAKAQDTVTSQAGGSSANNSCILCGENLPNEAAQMQHFKNCFMNKPHQCYTCGKSFHDPEIRGIHVRRIHDEEKVCLQCGLPIQTEQELESHVRLQCCKTFITFLCQHCDRRFYNEKCRTTHTAIHSAQKLLNCNFCNEKFVTESELFKHKDTNHLRLTEKPPMGGNYKCSLCGGTFDTETLKVNHSLNCCRDKHCFVCEKHSDDGKSRTDHITWDHTCFQQKQCVCLVCGKHFEDHKPRSEPITRDRTNEGKDLCRQCGLKCVSLYILKKHREFHCGTKQEETSNCPAVPIKQEPVDVEEGESIVCSVCWKQFSSEARLNEHSVVHKQDPPVGTTSMVKMDDKDGNTYQCELCSVLFISHKELLLHTYNIHNKYLCFYPTCGMTFNHMNRRLKHFDTHSVNNQKSVESVSRQVDSYSKSELEKSQSKVTQEEKKPDSSGSVVSDNSSKFLQQGNIPTSIVNIVEPKNYLVPETEKLAGIPVTPSLDKDKTQGTVSKVRSETPLISRHKRSVVNVKKKTPEPVYTLSTYACDVCSLKFTSLSDRAKHVLSHVGEKKFSCSICGKKFTLRTNLERHMTTHITNDSDNEVGPPFICRICGKVFITLEARNEHMHMHPCMNCSICGQHFSTRRGLMEHSANAHPKQISMNNIDCVKV